MGAASQHGSGYQIPDGSRPGSQVADAPTQPLPVVSGPGGMLAAQLARFGELVGRDLSARASGALRVRRAYDPARRDEERACSPLTPAEHQEMTALYDAIAGACPSADPGGAAAEGHSRPDGPPRPPRLRRRASAGSALSAGRHHRPAGTGPGHTPAYPV
jgi:hypothetical protein